MTNYEQPLETFKHYYKLSETMRDYKRLQVLSETLGDY